MGTIEFKWDDGMAEQFYREGYFYARGLISAEQVEALNREHEPFVSGLQGEEWKSEAFVSFARQSGEFPATASFLRTPHLVDLFERLLGSRVKLWMGMYAVVPPGGRGLEWHQDNMYTHILGHMLNGFIALDRIDQTNAGLWIAPRSHRLGRQKNLNPEGSAHRRAADPDNGIPCEPLNPGDAIIFHRETLHKSGRNATGKPRRAFAFQVASAVCRYAETGKLLEDRELLVPLTES